tara:strand:- start:111 stop:869 length:759 start_codon:yes stop_codon:yes gene_type:complete
MRVRFLAVAFLLMGLIACSDAEQDTAEFRVTTINIQSRGTDDQAYGEPAMQALLFEMTPREGHEDLYFSHAAKLRPILLQQEGLIHLERFKSQSRPEVILSHSLWRDEAAIARWRTNAEHHKSQTAGRYQHFADYRIRVAHVLQRHVQQEPMQEWGSVGFYNEAQTRPDRFILIVRTLKQPQHADGEVFASVTEADSFLILQEVSSEQAGRDQVRDAQGNADVQSAILSRVSRDYGMHDRTEAPQYFKPVER